MSMTVLMAALLSAPLVTALVVFVVSRWAIARDLAAFAGAGATAALAAALVVMMAQGAPDTRIVLATPLPDLEIAVRTEPMGAAFALLAAVLWTLVTVAATDWFARAPDVRPGRLQALGALSLGLVAGLALAANLVTMFLFYVGLVLAASGMIARRADAQAARAARFTFGVLIAAAFLLLLPAIAHVSLVAGTQEFTAGGILAGRVDTLTASILLVALVLGFAKAALFPFHAWLPATLGVPLPTAVLLNAVAGVQIGAFCILKVATMVFGPDLLAQTIMAQGLAWLAIAGVVLTSAIALGKDDLRARLVWSSIAQVSAVVLGAMIASPAAAAGAFLLLLGHGLAKTALLVGAGALEAGAGVTRVGALGGGGRHAPWLFGALTLAAISTVGLPPLLGAVGRFELAAGLAQTGGLVISVLWVGCALFALAALAAIPARAFTPGGDGTRFAGRPLPRAMVATAVLAAAALPVLFFGADAIIAFVAPSIGG